LAEYTILVRAVLDKANLQSDLDKSTLAAKPVKIKATVEMDDAQIQSQIGKWQNQLTRMQVGKIDIFNMPVVQNELNQLDGLIATFGTEGGASVGQVSAQFDNLRTAVAVATDNFKQMSQAELEAGKNAAQMAKEQMAAIQEQAIVENKAFDTKLQLTDQYNNKLQVMQAQNKDAFLNPEVQKNLTDFQTKLQSFDGSAKSVNELRSSFGTLDTSIKTTNASMTDVNKNGMNFVSMLELAAKKIVLWGIGTSLIYGTLKDIQSGIQYIKDLNKAMTDIQLVTGQTSEQVSKLANDFNKMATELSVSTLAIAAGATTWERAGYNAADAMDLLKSSTIQATLGNMSAADSTDRLIATLHGFGFEAKDSMGIIDKLVNLDNNYATSVDEISTALSYVSSIAKQAGLSFDQISAYITVLSSTTRQSSETIGTALKSLITRFEQVKAGVATDDMGENLNNVEKVLKTVNIALRDSADSFRPLGDVISEVAGRWKDFSEVQQAQIATAIAGTRQQNLFVAGKLPQHIAIYGNNRIFQQMTISVEAL
jgi:TP901 family phage tail tape measure protein